MDKGQGPWTSQLRELLLCIIDRKKSSKPISASQEILSTGKMQNKFCSPLLRNRYEWIGVFIYDIKFLVLSSFALSTLFVLVEMPLLLGVIASVLLMHPSLGSSAVDAFAAVGMMDPKLGVPLLLAILFYSNIFTRKDVICQNKLVRFLVVPSYHVLCA